MGLYLYMIDITYPRTDKMRARRIDPGTQNFMHLPVWMDSGKEDEP